MSDLGVRSQIQPRSKRAETHHWSRECITYCQALPRLFIMGNEQKPQLRNNQNGGELSFIVYNQSPVSNGSGLRHHVRSHAARSGWTGRKRNSTVVSGTLHPDSRNPSPPKRPHRQAATPRKARCAPYQAIAASPCKASVPKRSAGVSPATEPRTTKPAEKKYDGIQRRYMEVVLNEVYPLQSSIGNVYDSCSFFSVPWKPVFGVLIDFCEYLP